MFLVAVITFGAFTSIGNVSAQEPQMMQASGKFQPKFGSLQNKVCGLELCNSKSIPNLDLTPEVKEIIKETAPQNLALEKALQGGVASDILANYHAYKGISVAVEQDGDVEEVQSNFNNFANPDFYNQKAISTVMKAEDEVLDRSFVIPEYMKDSYANNEFPQYVPKEKPVLVTEPEELVPDTEIFESSTDIKTLLGLSGLSEEDLEFFNLGVCGPGTVWANGMCVVEDSVSANTDWAEYWSTNTKDDNEIVLDNVNMTDGVESIPLDGEPESQPIEETTPEVVLETMTVLNGTSNAP